MRGPKSQSFSDENYSEFCEIVIEDPDVPVPEGFSAAVAKAFKWVCITVAAQYTFEDCKLRKTWRCKSKEVVKIHEVVDVVKPLHFTQVHDG